MTATVLGQGVMPMVASHAEYGLRDGYVQHWLVAGPRALPTPTELGQAGATPLTPAAFGLLDDVVETGKVPAGGDALTWRYAHASDDHLIDLSNWLRSSDALEAWAYALVVSTSAEVIEAAVTAYAPPQVWINGALVDAHAAPDAGRLPWQPGQWRFHLPVDAARNHLIVRVARAPGGDTPTAFALHLSPSAANLKRAPLRVLLPLNLDPKWLRDRQIYEAALADAVLEQNVYTRGQRVGLKWVKHYENWARLTARLQTPQGMIFAEAFDVQTAPGRPIQQPLTMLDGPYEVLVLPDTRQYHDEKRLRVTRALPLFLSNTDFAAEPTGTPAGRRLDVLAHAARHKGDFFGELAKLVTGAWTKLDARAVHAALEQIQTPGRSLTLLVALLGLRLRYAGDDNFPADLRAPLDAALRAANYAAPAHNGEAAELLALTAAVLAGQIFPERASADSVPTLLAWLRQRGQFGFAAPDSAEIIEASAVALSHLVALADDDDLAELASVLLDKVFFELAVNSFRGVYGAAHAAAPTGALLTARQDPTAPLSWLLWGQGCLNQHLAGVVSLAVNAEYQLPDLLAAIAAHKPSALLHRAASGPEGSVVHTVTYKTPDFMLSAALDDRPGAPGDREQAWQATLGPDATVFVNQPANLSFSDLHRPNFWRGNVTRPRVAQWNDALIAIYTDPPAGAGLGYTHAHFPLSAFHAHALREGWAFAQLGASYLALTAQNGLTLPTTGDAAQRELRSPGGANTWLCQLGRFAADGSFADFQNKVLDAPVHWQPQGVDWTTLRGEALTWNWTGPLLVNAAPVELATSAHLDNPYTQTPRGAAQLDVVLGEQGLRLIFDEATGAV